MMAPFPEREKNGTGASGAGIESTIWSINLAGVHMRKAETTNFSPKEEFVAGKQHGHGHGCIMTFVLQLGTFAFYGLFLPFFFFLSFFLIKR